jgi:outer membrane protein OmpA-like peptidoglycan-associated protein
LVLAIGVALGASAPARAELKQQRHLVELGLFLGVDFIRSKHHDLMDHALPHRAYAPAAFDVGLRFAYLPIPWFGIELEGNIVPTKTQAHDVAALIYGIKGHGILQIPVGKRIAPFLVIGGGAIGVSAKDTGAGKDIDGEFHWGLGFKWYFNPWGAFRLDLRHIVTDGTNNGYSNHFSILAGLSLVLNWKKQPKDRDKDGILDVSDRCPDEAGPAPSGCPDTDGDGVIDPDDKCPKVPAKTADGCPPPDRDKDGVVDADDKCPDVAGPAPTGCPDTDGDGVLDKDDKCPQVPAKTADGCPPDQDGDGVPDDKDKCPTVAAKTPDGCPPDRDGDGIPDHLDKCPDQPETRNGYQDEDGCPDELPKAVQRFSGTIEGILFATGSAKIQRASFRLLDQAVAMLKQFPDIRIRVRGHTDNVGNSTRNLKLSQDRAASVRAYFMSKGIEERRIESEGLGDTEPVGDNKTPKGRAKNRRIEFKILQ